MVSCAGCRLGSQSRFCQEEKFFLRALPERKFLRQAGQSIPKPGKRIGGVAEPCIKNCLGKILFVGIGFPAGSAAPGRAERCEAARRRTGLQLHGRRHASRKRGCRKAVQSGRGASRRKAGVKAKLDRGIRPASRGAAAGRRLPSSPSAASASAGGTARGSGSRAAPLLPVCLLRHPLVRTRRPARQAPCQGALRSAAERP
jgi:hypothetical protein